MTYFNSFNPSPSTSFTPPPYSNYPYAPYPYAINSIPFNPSSFISVPFYPYSSPPSWPSFNVSLLNQTSLPVAPQGPIEPASHLSPSTSTDNTPSFFSASELASNPSDSNSTNSMPQYQETTLDIQPLNSSSGKSLTAESQKILDQMFQDADELDEDLNRVEINAANEGETELNILKQLNEINLQHINRMKELQKTINLAIDHLHPVTSTPPSSSTLINPKSSSHTIRTTSYLSKTAVKRARYIMLQAISSMHTYIGKRSYWPEFVEGLKKILSTLDAVSKMDPRVFAPFFLNASKMNELNSYISEDGSGPQELVQEKVTNLYRLNYALEALYKKPTRLTNH